jgi:predicted RND superfamily exporter protein
MRLAEAGLAGGDFAIHNEQRFMTAIVGLIYREMNRIALLTAGLFLLALWIEDRNPRRLLRLTLPIAVNLVWCFGLMGWLDIRVNLVNSLVIVFLFGVIVDYAIFMTRALEAWREGDVEFPAAAGAAVAISALTTMIGFAVLIAARHPMLQSIGHVTLIGVVSGLVSVYVLSPILQPGPASVSDRGGRGAARASNRSSRG